MIHCGELVPNKAAFMRRMRMASRLNLVVNYGVCSYFTYARCWIGFWNRSSGNENGLDLLHHIVCEFFFHLDGFYVLFELFEF